MRVTFLKPLGIPPGTVKTDLGQQEAKCKEINVEVSKL